MACLVPLPVIIPIQMAQPFPQIPAPFVNPETGVINQIWLQLLITLWNRTGGAPGTGASTTDIFNYVIADENLSAERENASAGELGLLGGDSALAEFIRSEIERQLLLIAPPSVVDPLVALLFDSPSSLPEEETCSCASWVPEVDGSEPPNFITDGAGNLVFTAFGP